MRHKWLIAGMVACLGLCGCKKSTSEPAKGSSNPASSTTDKGTTKDNGPAPAKVAITHATVDRIHLGMSADDVKRIAGSPQSETLTGDTTVMGWSTGSLIVTLEKGKVVSKIAIGMQQDAAKLTKANVDKVIEGMTPEAVVELLGSPSQEMELVNAKSMSWEASWPDGEKFVNVIFDKGKVKARVVQAK